MLPTDSFSLPPLKELIMKPRITTLLVLACMTSTLAAQDASMVATVKGNVPEDDGRYCFRRLQDSPRHDLP